MLVLQFAIFMVAIVIAPVIFIVAFISLNKLAEKGAG